MSVHVDWLDFNTVLQIHDRVIHEFGGRDGIRDEGLLDSALSKPVNVHYYSRENNIPTLATYYAIGITKNHPFLDGNKRTGVSSAMFFAEVNRYSIDLPYSQGLHLMESLAAGSVTDDDFIRQIVRYSRPR